MRNVNVSGGCGEVRKWVWVSEEYLNLAEGHWLNILERTVASLGVLLLAWWVRSVVNFVLVDIEDKFALL